LWGIVALLVLLVALRIALPHFVEHWLDGQLRALDGYSGRVEDVDLQLWRGGAVLTGIEIVKESGEVPVPFIEVAEIDGSVQWSEIMRGAIVAEATIRSLVINFVEGPSERTSQYGEGVDWQKELLALSPLDINRLVIVEGEIHFRDFHSEPPVNAYVQNLDATLTNLSNVRDREQNLPARLDARGLLFGSGELDLEGRLDLLASTVEFEIDVEAKTLKLSDLNPMLKAYVGVDAQGGVLSLYSELRGHENRVDGYAKPILENVDMFEAGESGDFFDRAGDAFVGAGLEIIENQPRERIATRVPVSGSLENLQTNPWVAAFGIVRNAYINAFSHGLGMNRPTQKGEE